MSDQDLSYFAGPEFGGLEKLRSTVRGSPYLTGVPGSAPIAGPIQVPVCRYGQ